MDGEPGPTAEGPGMTAPGSAAILGAPSISPLDAALGPEGELPQSSGLARHVGRRAERAALSVRIHRATSQGDALEAARCQGELARRWHKSGLDLREAVNCAAASVRALPDRVLSEHLSSWFEGMGCWDAAARELSAILSQVEPGSLAKWHYRIAELYWRGGDAGHAAHHLAEAARLDPLATEALEALGALSDWASDAVGSDRAVVAWLESARRLTLRGDRLGAFDALLRAFDLCPASPLAADHLAQELSAMGRVEAADEVMRLSARAAGEPERHRTRAVQARSQGNPTRALSAMLDGRFDAVLDLSSIVAGIDRLLVPAAGDSAVTIDSVLSELGLGEWLSVRLELTLLLEATESKAQGWMTLARLESVGLVHHDEAREALVRALLLSPDHREARAALEATSQLAEDAPQPIVRALVEAARVPREPQQVVQLAEELHALSLRGEGSAVLWRWASERLPGGTASHDAEWNVRCDEERARAENLKGELRFASEDQRPGLLEALEKLLALDPDATLDHAAVVAALVDICPTDRRWQSRLIELLDVVSLLPGQAEEDPRVQGALQTAAGALGERGLIAQARWWLRRGQSRAAINLLSTVVDGTSGSSKALLFAFLLARHTSELGLAARALVRVASLQIEPLRGVLEAHAAELLVEAGDYERAFSIVRSVVRSPSNLARLGSLEVTLSGMFDARSTTEIVERTLGVVPPTTQLAAALARAHFTLEQTDLGLTWAQRAVALRPGRAALRCELLEAVLALADPVRVGEQLLHLPDAPIPASSYVGAAASALAWLVSAEPLRAADVARRLLERLGAHDPSFRAALLEAARATHDDAFALDVLERASASATSANDIDHVILERRWRCDDIAGSVHVALRSVRAGGSPEQWTYLALAHKQPLAPDAELERLELLAGTLRDSAMVVDRVRALRELGVARFDLAQDTEGAVAAWEQAASLDPRCGMAVLARDLSDIVGSRSAIAWLSDYASRLSDNERAGRALGFAAQIAYEAHDKSRTLELIGEALAVDATRADLLRLAERATDGVEAYETLDSLYELASHGVLGVFGDRALHYRAARTFERLGAAERAMAHAVAAFEAVPAEGATLALLSLLCRETGELGVFVTAIMRVAERAGTPRQAAAWLTRARNQLSDSDQEVRTRFEIGIRLLTCLPGPRAVYALDSELKVMDARSLDDRESSRERLRRVLSTLVDEADGPDGARLAIAVADVALGSLAAPELGRVAVLRALLADADLEEFTQLADSAARWRVAPSEGQQLIAEAVEVLLRPYANVARPALHAISKIAVVVGASEHLSRLAPIYARFSVQDWRKWAEGESCSPEGRTETEEDTTNRGIERALSSGDTARACHLVDEALERAGWDVPASFTAQPSDGQEDDADPLLAKTQGGSGSSETYRLIGLVLERLHDDQGLRAAREALEKWRENMAPHVAGELAVAVERRGGDISALCRALAHRALLSDTTVEQRSAWLHQAAVLAESAGDFEAALGYYRAVRSVSARDPAIELGYSVVLYRLGGFFDNPETREVIEWLQSLRLEPASPDGALLAYLLVRAQLSVGDVASAWKVLAVAREARPEDPRLLLLEAERLAAAYDARAIDLYHKVLSADLGRVHSRAEVALEGAERAIALGDLEQAGEWLSIALDDPVTHAAALTLEAELSGEVDYRREGSMPPVALAEGVGDCLLDGTVVVDAPQPAATLPASAAVATVPPWPAEVDTAPLVMDAAARAALGKLTMARTPSSKVGMPVCAESGANAAVPVSAPVDGVSPPGLAVSSAPATLLASARVDGASTTAFAESGAPAAVPASVATAGPRTIATIPASQAVTQPPSEGGAPGPSASLTGSAEALPLVAPKTHGGGEPVVSGPSPVPTDAPDRLGEVVVAALPVHPETADGTEPSGAVPTMGMHTRARQDGVAATAVEPDDLRAAIATAQSLLSDPGRVHAWVADGRRWLRRWPTSVSLCRIMRDVARIEQHHSHAAALDHVLGVLTGEAVGGEPPDLAEQPVDAAAIRVLLMKDLATPAAEAVALVWEGAEHAFRRELADYGVTGLERVTGTTTTPQSRIFTEACWRLGATRTPLFYRHGQYPLRATVGLTSPVSVILEGEPGMDERSLACLLGSVIFATLPEHALMFGLLPEYAVTLLKALHIAFGNPTRHPTAEMGEAMRLAEVLWESVRSRGQRRLRELCEAPFDYGAVLEASRQSLFRAGLYVSGDLPAALGQFDLSRDDMHRLATARNFTELGAREPGIMDLFRLATSAEYADMRFVAGRNSTLQAGTRPW